MALIFSVTITGILSNSMIGPAIPDILDEFGQETSRAGVLVAVGSIPGIVVAPMIGFAADRFGRKRVLVPCLVIFGAFGIVAATAQTFTVLLAARFAMGFGSAGMINLAVVMIGDNFTGLERTKVIGRNSAVLTTGLALAPLLSGGITEVAGWRWALSAYSMALVTAVLVTVYLDDFRPEQHGQGVASQVREAVQVLRQPILLMAVVSGTLVFALIFGVFLATLPVHLEEEFGLSAGWRGVVLSVPAVTSTFVSVNLARLRQQLGIRRILVAGAVLFVAAFATLGSTTLLAVAVIAAIAYGLGEGAMIPTLQDVAVSAAPDRHRGGVLAGWVGAVRLGQTVGPLLASVAIAGTGTGNTMLIGAGLAGILVLMKALGPIDDANLHAAQTRAEA